MTQPPSKTPTSSPPRMLRVRVTSGDVHASLLRPHQVLVAADDAARVAVRSHSLWRLQGDATAPALVQLVCDRRSANTGGLCAGVVQLHAWALDALGLRDGDAATLEPTAQSSPTLARIVLAVVTRSPLATTTTSSSSLSSLSTSSDRALESAAAATYALLPESVRSGLVDLKNAVARQLLAMYGGGTRAIARGDLVPVQFMGETFVFRTIQIEHEQASTDDEDRPPMAVDVLGCHAMGDGVTATIEALSSTIQDLQLTDDDTELTSRLARLGFCGYTALIQEALFHILLNFPSRESTILLHGGDATAVQSLASRGLLLHGVSGVGKSLALRVLDTELQRRGIATWHVDAMALLMEFENAKAASAYEFLQAHFRQFLPAYGQQQRHGSSPYATGVVLIDDLHVLFQSSNGQDSSDGDQSGLLLMPLGSALLRCLDAMADQSTHGLCIVGTATTGNDEDAGGEEGGGGLPPVAKRSGRFDKVIEMIVPTEAMRKELLASHLEPLPLETGSVARDLASRLAVLTGGYVAKDLVRICRSAYVHAFSSVEREIAASPNTAVTWDHLVLAQRQIQPSQLQQLNVASPSTDVRDPSDGPFAGYAALQKQLGDWIDWKFHPSEAMKHLGVANASGLLIHGPSGCGKSLLVKALAASAKVNFVSVKSSELLSKYFGDSERAVRQLFARARAASPCLLFFDEFDAIAHKRSFGGADASGGDGSGVYARILSTFLNEMDGVGGSRSRAADVLVVAATNRMDALDAALIRPGRIDKAVELGYPQREDTQAILTFYTRNMPLASDVDLAALASRPTGSRPFTGADLAAVCKEAAFRSLRERIDAQHVCGAHFVTAWDQRAGLS